MPRAGGSYKQGVRPEAFTLIERTDPEREQSRQAFDVWARMRTPGPVTVLGKEVCHV